MGASAPPAARNDQLEVIAMSWTALVLLDRPSTPGELAEHFGGAGAPISVQQAQTLIEKLTDRGLVRVARVTDVGGRRVVRTVIGDHLVGALVGQSSLDERLIELERLRGDLLSTIAHEVRTPLTAIRTSVGLLLDPATRASKTQRTELLRTIERNAERIQQHADDVLDLARFRAGHVRLGLRRFDARVIPAEVVDTLAPSLEAKQQDVEIDVSAEPVWVIADHRRIERAVLNIVANAHKFSPENSSIGIAVRTTGSDVVWEVSDRGPGIPPEQHDQLFERFFVGAADSGQRGSGLGLPIALAIAQAHGGRIEFDSAVGRGSTFSLIVPAIGSIDHEP